MATEVCFSGMTGRPLLLTHGIHIQHFLSRVLTLVIVKVEDQLKFYKSRIGRAKSATALACQMLSICVRAFMTFQNDPEKGRNHGPTSILQEDICHLLI